MNLLVKIFTPLLLIMFLQGCKPDIENTAPVIGDALMVFWNVDDSYRSNADAYQKAYFHVSDTHGLNSIDYVSIKFGDLTTVVLRENGVTIENNASSDEYYSTNYKYNGSNPDRRPVTALITVRDKDGAEATKQITTLKPDRTPLDAQSFIYSEDYAGSDTLDGILALKKPSITTAVAGVNSITLSGVNANDINADSFVFWFFSAGGEYVGYYQLSTGEFVNNANFDLIVSASQMYFYESYSITDAATIYPETYSQPRNDSSHFAENSPYIALGAEVNID